MIHLQKPQKIIIFLHIPKTGGSTLHHIINKKYKEKKDLYSISHGLRDNNAIENFKKYPLDKLKKLRVLKGHMPFGLHNYLPRSSTYITMVREPVQRIISYYYYLLRTPDHFFYKQGMSAHLSLENFVKDGISAELDNGQTRLIAGVHDEINFGKCTYQHFLLAKENIDKYFSLVGIMEQFDETLLLLKNIFEWQHMPLYVKKNVNLNKIYFNNFPDQTLKIIKQYNQYDIKLYNYAKKKFQNKLSNIKYRKIIVPAYQSINKIYQLFNNE